MANYYSMSVEATGGFHWHSQLREFAYHNVWDVIRDTCRIEIAGNEPYMSFTRNEGQFKASFGSAAPERVESLLQTISAEFPQVTIRLDYADHLIGGRGLSVIQNGDIRYRHEETWEATNLL
jgi:hypothetical protein